MSGIEQVAWNITCTDTFKSKLLRAEIPGYLFGGKKKERKKIDCSRISLGRRFTDHLFAEKRKKRRPVHSRERALNIKA